MFLTYIPGDQMTGSTFNVATNSATTQQIFWQSVGRM
jgi:hypothetical protein